MPNYVYKNCCGKENGYGEEDLIINVPMADRDLQYCAYCGEKRKRKIAFTGTVWAPTSTGATHK